MQNFVETFLTWDEIAAIEPQLAMIFDEARQTTDDEESESFCAHSLFHGVGGFKDALSQYVGWSAGDFRLRTDQAYNAAYRKIRDCWPPCRNWPCL
jgi:hypothetical protein